MGGDTARCQHQPLAEEDLRLETCDWTPQIADRKRRNAQIACRGKRTQEEKGGAKWCRIGKKIRRKLGGKNKAGKKI